MQQRDCLIVHLQFEIVVVKALPEGFTPAGSRERPKRLEGDGERALVGACLELEAFERDLQFITKGRQSFVMLDEEVDSCDGGFHKDLSEANAAKCGVQMSPAPFDVVIDPPKRQKKMVGGDRKRYVGYIELWQ